MEQDFSKSIGYLLFGSLVFLASIQAVYATYLTSSKRNALNLFALAWSAASHVPRIQPNHRVYPIKYHILYVFVCVKVYIDLGHIRSQAADNIKQALSPFCLAMFTCLK